LASENFTCFGGERKSAPNSGTNGCITNGVMAHPTVVTLGPNSNGSVASLQLNSFNVLNINDNSTLSLHGPSVINGGAINLNGAGNGTSLYTGNGGTVTLNGGGTLTLVNAAHNVNTVVYGINGAILHNITNTIQGEGQIGSPQGMSVLNDRPATILANVNGQTLTINGSGSLTNDGTLQANAGSTLRVASNITFTNFSGNTLTGGTYNVYGTLQIDSLGNRGGEIVRNSGTILLSGRNSQFIDAAGKDALSSFGDNTGTGSFTINNGRDFTSVSGFVNEGLLTIGRDSTFGEGTEGAGSYMQTHGVTLVDGTLIANGGIAINGGTLKGIGQLIGNVGVNGGTVVPGDSPGILMILNDYFQSVNSGLDIVIGGADPGTGYSVLDVLGNAEPGGLLQLTSIDGFVPFVGEKFFVMNYGSRLNNAMFAGVTWANLNPGLTFSTLYNPTNIEIDVSSAVSTPEPGTLWTLATAIAGLAGYHRFRVGDSR
jgi:hypothetical protein